MDYLILSYLIFERTQTKILEVHCVRFRGSICRRRQKKILHQLKLRINVFLLPYNEPCISSEGAGPLLQNFHCFNYYYCYMEFCDHHRFSSLHTWRGAGESGGIFRWVQSATSLLDGTNPYNLDLRSLVCNWALITSLWPVSNSFYWR